MPTGYCLSGFVRRCTYTELISMPVKMNIMVENMAMVDHVVLSGISLSQLKAPRVPPSSKPVLAHANTPSRNIATMGM